MKKYIILLSIVFYTVATSQVILNENFENYTLGNLGTDPTGVMPGQGGWLTTLNTKDIKTNDSFQIVNVPVKNKVLQLSLTGSKRDTTSDARASLTITNLMDEKRTSGNNVIKFELDFYTGGAYQTTQHTGQGFYLGHDDFGKPYSGLFGISIDGKTGTVRAYVYDGKLNPIVYLDNSQNNVYPIVPFNTWITFVVYLDYNNKMAYFETPFFNSVVKAGFLNQSTLTDLIKHYKPIIIGMSISNIYIDGNQYFDRKYDNIKITALNAVPPHILSAESFLAQKFNLYPNPATNIVNITNGENLLVQQIAVYDTAGKLITTENYNNQTEIQLNVEHLASGTYLLHLKTNEGTAVKKLVKK